MALASNQQAQYDQLIKAGASPQAAQQAAMLVPAQATPMGNAVIPTAPAGTSPPTPAPQIQTPAAPTVPTGGGFQQPAPPSTTVNVNTAPTPTGASATPTTPKSTSTTQSTTTGQPLTMPTNGSVVDLLNQAGQDSSYAARQQLAQQYGIQGYTGTAAQNQDLSKKYLDAYNANKGKTVPDTGAQAASALDTYFQDNTQKPQEDPQRSFFDNYMALNPVVKNLYDTINQTLSSIGTQTTFAQQYQDLTAQQGIPALQTDLMNINNIMDGTEDDIRDEVTKAGGFATESQVQALAGARNKTLLKQANVLSNQLQAKEDYINQVMQFSQADRAEVDKQIDQKLGLTTQLANIQDKVINATKDNYNNIIQTQGYGGLYTALQNNPQQMGQVETLLGLGQGGLKQLANYTKPLTAQEQVQLENSKLQGQNYTLQNKKLTQELSAGPATPSLQFVGGTANQPAGTFNPKTGVFTPIEGSQGTSPLAQAQAQANIEQITNLLTTPKLAGAVGAGSLQRITPFNEMTTGQRSNFLAGAQQITNQLTLNALQNAKANGATFGALSEGELSLLSASATKLNTWAVKDKNGNITGYATSPTNFKTELDKIGNFAKLDYVLKGGDPTSVGVTETPDGRLWSKNSDGTVTEIR